jgi:hypothetical protein
MPSASAICAAVMGKLGRIGLEPAQRYERARPGELLHIDVKKLGRIQGGAGKYWRSDQYQTNGKAERFIRTLLASWAYEGIHQYAAMLRVGMAVTVPESGAAQGSLRRSR